MKVLELKVPPLVLTLLFAFLIWIIARSDPFICLEKTYQIAAIIIFLVGSVLCVLAILGFKKHKTTVNPVMPEKSEHLVIDGIYKYTRNPMYLSFLLWLVSLGIYLGSIVSLATLPLFVAYMNAFQIIPEEKILQKKFAYSYMKYKASTRRWI